MPASLLQTLPSARLLAAVLVVTASLLHFVGVLPPRGWTIALPLTVPVFLAAGMLAVKRSRPVLAAVTRAAVAFSVMCPLVLWQVHEALERRLPPALEGVDLEVTGVVDTMPQRFDFGDRVRFTLSSCRRIDVGGTGGEGGEGGEGEAGEAGEALKAEGCGRLGRLQLDWGPPRAKDRLQSPTRAAEENSRNSGIDGGADRQEADDRGDHRGDDRGDDRGDYGDGDARESGAAAERPGRGWRRPSDVAGRTSAGAWSDDIWPEPGQFWRLTVRLKRPVANANPGGFDLELRYLQQGVGAIGRVQARRRLQAPAAGGAWQRGLGIVVVFESLRSRLRDRLEAVFAHRVDPPTAAGKESRWPLLGVVGGLALGDQGAISASLWGLFSRTGVSHLMAISGMHVTMLALMAAWLAGRLLKALTARRIPGLSRLLGSRPRQVLVLIVAVLAAFGYALLSGWGIPSQRTCWMLTAAAMLSLSGRGRGALDVTLLAAAVVVLVDPWAASTAGFWLSFCAVAAILWCAHSHDGHLPLRPSPAVGGRVRIPQGVRDAVTSQWAATIGLAPLVVALFSILSLIGPVANAVAIPWVSFVVTPLAVAAVLVSPLHEPLCTLLLQVDLWMIGHLVGMLRLLDRLPAASVAIARPGTWTLVAAIVGAALAIAPPGVPMRRAGLLCLLPMLFAPSQVPRKGELWITALDIGQGSSILVETADSRLLYDTGAGSGPERSAAARHLVPYLRSRGIERIDTLVVSHLDVEHAGGAAAVLQSLQPTRLMTAFDARLLEADPEILSGVSHLPCTAGQRLPLGDASVQVLHPVAPARSRAAARDNAGSCVVLIASQAGSILLTGDLPASAEAALASASRAGGDRAGGDRAGARGGGLKADVLVVPQQGSRQATGAVLLAAVRPSFVVLQVGYRNRHGHPHPAVLQRLSGTGAALLRTDQDGAVQIRLSAAGTAQVRRMRRDSPPYWRVDTAAIAPSNPHR